MLQVNKHAYGQGAVKELDEGTMALINNYAIEPLSPEDVFVGKILLANNAVDRDGERFHEDFLKRLQETIKGKSLLQGHRWGDAGIGLYFESEIITMSLKEAEELTKEKLQLPEGEDTVHFLKVYYYIMNTPHNEGIIANIKGGICRHASIGFSAEKRNPVNDEEGNTLYHEYSGDGEALEGSFVWLGAQYASTTTKAKGQGGDNINKQTKNKKTEDEEMKKDLTKKLGISPEATEQDVLKSVSDLVTRNKHLEPIVDLLGDDVTVEEVKAMVDNAKSGEKFKKSLVDDIVKVEEIKGRFSEADGDADPKKVEARKTLLMGRSIDELEDDHKLAKKELETLAPADSELGGDSLPEKKTPDGKRRSFRNQD